MDLASHQMTTLTITAADLDAYGFYAGSADVSNYQGHIEIVADLGWVRFKASLGATGSICAFAGSGIEAGWGIKAGFSISAKILTARLRIFAGLCAWRLPTPEEMQIHVEVLSGTVAFGEVVSPAKDGGA